MWWPTQRISHGQLVDRLRHSFLPNRVGLEAGFGFGFRKQGFSRKCWLSGRFRLPSIQKLLASISASASSNAVFDGFGFDFVLSFTAGFSFGFGFPEFCAWLPRIQQALKKIFIHKLHFDFYLSAGDSFRLHPLVAPYLMPFSVAAL